MLDFYMVIGGYLIEPGNNIVWILSSGHGCQEVWLNKVRFDVTACSDERDSLLMSYSTFDACGFFNGHEISISMDHYLHPRRDIFKEVRE
ncbi:hypothetical protein D3C84_1022320 [compost metagenome]